MAMSITYVRPDRVIKTGVIAPYPIRQNDPVQLARNVLIPFINGIRSNGPMYQNPQPQTMADAMVAMNGFGAAHGGLGAGAQCYGLRGAAHPQRVPMPAMPTRFLNQVLGPARVMTQATQLPGMVRMGNQPIAMRYRQPVVANSLGPQVVRQVSQSGGVPRYQYDAARAQYYWEKAASRGNVWDMIFARQREMRLMRR